MSGFEKFSSPSLQSIYSTLLVAFRNDFPKLQLLLESVSQHAQFPAFLKNYGGLARRNLTTAEALELEPLTADMGARFVSFFRSIFSLAGFVNSNKTPSTSTPVTKSQPSASITNSFSAREISELLSAFEGAVNLALSSWCGNNDRNFQFRTVVHFCCLHDLGDTLFENLHSSYLISFSEDGFRFGSPESQHVPKCLPSSLASGLWQFSTPQDFSSGNDAKVFARVRTVQREICLLVDEWEHRNTLLAVEHTLAREDYRTQPSPETQALFQKTLQKMSVHRDRLAQWCLTSFQDFQEFLAKAHLYSKHNPDIVAEIHACDSLLLSGIQKIFLPASVSRHKYDRFVAQKILDWCILRKQSHPEDLSLEFVRVSMSLALGNAESGEFLETLLNSKSYEWKLDFDPCPGLKTFCWLLNSSDFSILTLAALCALGKKMNPNSLDSYWMGNLASLAQMPETFLLDAPFSLPSRLTVSPQLFASLKECAVDALSKTGQSLEQQQCRQFLLDFMKHDGG